MPEFLPLLRDRRSIRAYDGTHVLADDELAVLLAPSVRRWAPAASALLFTLNQVASGPEADALGYSDYAQYDLGQAVAHLTVQAAALGPGVHQFAAFDHDGPRRRPAHRVRARPPHRRPLAELAFAGRFGEALAF
jgi:hypothetical protein